ncbi:hypothetical protein [Archangium primigenium]|uniref:hypothetical protein n=1 Tax=[Archangium] primigenium TaxID=2792470 RepID=UPI001956E64D|nr:hypothetical protein [Archangium primigenium]MBM7112121.1 hypothetical protein [Archangium primigenium]
MRRDIERMRREAERNPRPAYVDDRQPSPCFDQTKEQIETWLRVNVKMGTEVAVRETQGHILRYTIASVNYLGKGRFGLGSFGSFYYNGKNCFHPKGQTCLVMPTNAVREFIQRHPQGAFSLARDGYRVGFY